MSQRSRRTRSTKTPREDTFSQPSSSQGTARGKLDRFTLLDLPAELVEKFANDCVYYLLIADQKKIPIKKPDIVKNVLKDKPKAFSVVIDAAAIKLNKVFGIELVKPNDAKGYMLKNLHKLDSGDIPLWSEIDECKQSLLTIILLNIFMNGNSMLEKRLWTALKKFDIYQDVDHEIFGDVKKLVNDEFVKQLYLEMSVCEAGEERTHEYHWGTRARAEVSKKDILDFACLLYGNGMKPQSWPTQFKEMLEEQNTQENQTNESQMDQD